MKYLEVFDLREKRERKKGNWRLRGSLANCVFCFSGAVRPGEILGYSLEGPVENNQSGWEGTRLQNAF